MKLIKFYAKGFKSFADPVHLNFDGGVVGVIGPNGSGKSNINDAIKWVLGEQSSKSLRGENMEDVIFAGSQKVKSLDKATVTLTFDNRERTVSLPHDTISITRELERGAGSNKYYINDELVRYKDIKDIVLESGISKSSLAIISQGTVSDIAEATPESRRLIFEEAAGVSKYKFRKTEALRKLEKTAESLSQIQAVVNELEKQLRPLANQAEKAKIYIEKSRELKSIEVGALVHNLNYYRQKLNEYKIQLEGVSETRTNLEEHIKRAEQSILLMNDDRLEKETKLNTINKTLEKINDGLRQLEQIDAVERSRREMILSGDLKASIEEKIEVLKKSIAAAQTKANFSQKQLFDLNSRIEKNHEEIKINDNEINNVRINQSKTFKAINETRTKISILQDHKKNKTNMFRGVKTILEHSSIFKGYQGLVSDLIEVKEEYNLAVEAALSNSLQHIVVDNSDTAVQAINFLKQNDGGRATFIPLKSITPKSVRREHLVAISTMPGFIGVGSELIGIAPKLQILLDFLLGNILFTEDIESAKNLDNILDHKYMIVTLYGDVIRAGGVMTGGTTQATSNLLGLDEQIEKLQATIPQLEREEERLSNLLTVADSKRQSIISLNSELTVEKGKVQSVFEYETNNLERFKSEYETLSGTELEIKEDTELQQRILKSHEERTLLNAEKRSLQERVGNINQEIHRATQEKTEFENSLRNLNNSFSKVTNEHNKAEFILQENQKRLAEFYNMTLEVASSQYILEMPIEEAEVLISKLKSEIKDLGNVNVEAIQQYEDLSARYDELKTAENEIVETKTKIEEAIREMDKIIVERMNATLDEIGVEFNNVFKSMFGGGHALVQYVDPKDPLESGIDIKAQPPGKSITTMRLFSGGEKALIAISLLFAILKSRPLALCILDEVEAALDEANVVRYAEYLQELKPKTQFLVITHRHGTMSRVDHLFGATMQTRGVTSFFSVKLAEAQKLVEDVQVEA